MDYQKKKMPVTSNSSMICSQALWMSYENGQIQSQDSLHFALKTRSYSWSPRLWSYSFFGWPTGTIHSFKQLTKFYIGA